MDKIQVLKPFYRVDECLNEIKECLEIGWTGMGFKTTEFENKWKDYTGLNNAHFLNSATVGLHLAIKILKEVNGWNDGDEVISTALTFVSTNHAIKYENLKPIFADVDKSLNLNPDSVRAKITSKTKAIVFVGVAGNTANLLEVIKIAKDNNLKIILDAAHMAGSRISGKHVGFDCDVSVFSFQAVKNLPTADSGMICFTEEKLDKKARELSWLGINKDTFSRSKQGSYKWDYNVTQIGYKYHGNSVIAALGLVGLKYLDDDNERRRAIVNLYKGKISESFEVIEHESLETSRHLFQILVEDREKIIDFLAQNGVYPGVHYRVNSTYEPYKGTKLINAEFYSQRLLSLPLHLYLKDEEIIKICDLLLEYNRKS